MGEHTATLALSGRRAKAATRREHSRSTPAPPRVPAYPKSLIFCLFSGLGSATCVDTTYVP